MKKTNQENKKLCSNCDECCRYVALQIDKPTTKTEYQNIIWLLLHENVGVYIDYDNDWFVEFITPCKKLKNKLCSDYNNRPKICRDYSQEDCTYYNHEPVEKIYFHNEQEFKKYLINKKIKFEFKK
jgi:uncharacterized protein